MINKLFSTAVAIAMTAGFAGSAARADEGGVKAGFLTCNVDSGWGFVFGSTRDLKCTYSHDGGSLERYVGHIDKFGVDIGYTSGGVIVWAVLAPTSDVGNGALAGEYGGVTGGASIGVGAAAHVLAGGLKKSIALQPLSVEGTTGLNVAAGITGMSLEYQP